MEPVVDGTREPVEAPPVEIVDADQGEVAAVVAVDTTQAESLLQTVTQIDEPVPKEREKTERPKEEWFSFAMQQHPEIFALYERSKALYTQPSDQTTPSLPIDVGIMADIIPQPELIQMILEYFAKNKYNESLELLEHRTGQIYQNQQKQGNVSRLELLCRLGSCGVGDVLGDLGSASENNVTQPMVVYSTNQLAMFDKLPPLSPEISDILTFPYKCDVDLNSIHPLALMWIIIWRKSAMNLDEKEKRSITLPDNVESIFLNTFASFLTTQQLIDNYFRICQAIHGPNVIDAERKNGRLFLTNQMKKSVNEFAFILNENQTSALQAISDEVNKSTPGTKPLLARRKIQSQKDRLSLVPVSFTTPKPLPKVPRNLFSPSMGWYDVEDEELARQLSLMDYEIVRQLKPIEFFAAMSGGTKNAKLMANLSSLTKRQTLITKWVVKESNSAPTTPSIGGDSRRLIGGNAIVKPTERFIRVMDHLIRMNNFNSAKGIYDAIINLPGQESRTREDARIVEEAKKLFTKTTEAKGLYPNYPTSAERLVSPSIPAADIVTAILESVDSESQESVVLPHNHINFQRKMNQFQIIDTILEKSTSIPYNFEHILQITNLIESDLNESSGAK